MSKWRILKRWGIYYAQWKCLWWHTAQQQMMGGTHDIEFQTEREARAWISHIEANRADKGKVIRV